MLFCSYCGAIILQQVIDADHNHASLALFWAKAKLNSPVTALTAALLKQCAVVYRHYKLVHSKLMKMSPSKVQVLISTCLSKIPQNSAFFLFTALFYIMYQY